MPVTYQFTKLGFDATEIVAGDVQLPVPNITEALKFDVLGWT
jgi:hypothetical protein